VASVDSNLDALVEALRSLCRGNFSTRYVVTKGGPLRKAGDAFNELAALLEANARELLDVSKLVGRDGQMTERASIEQLSGQWRAQLEAVNSLIGDLVRPSTEVARVITAVAEGDLSQKMALEIDGKPLRGEFFRVGTTVNTMVDQLRSFASEVTRVAREVGTEGKLGGQAHVPGVAGTWKGLTDTVNSMASHLTGQVRNIALVTTAVANGDLSKKITVNVQGELLELKYTINTMVDQLRSFTAEVTRVAREVGTDGKLGGQAHVPGIAGTWSDLTEHVNSMASNVTTQVRGIAKVVTAVANGDLSKKFVVAAKGEIAELADTINDMTDTLRVFADQVTTVAREVGTEGKLGGQAKVPGAAGIWRDLTDNVNQLANNLTGQVRAIADVAQAVTEGDLTRSITVEARGEVFALRERVNQMIAYVRETTQKNHEQDWLKTNLAKFSGMMQEQKSLESVSRLIMSELTPLVGAAQGAFFIAGSDPDETDGVLRLIASYAFTERRRVANRFRVGEGLVGQCALEKKTILLANCPPDYVRIMSGLGEATPLSILVFPVLFEDEVRAVVELASFQPFGSIHRIFLDQLSESIGVVLNTIEANVRTEGLLKQSQQLTLELQSQSRELQAQQAELKRSNIELEEQAKSLKASEEMLKQQQEELQQVNEELEEKAALLAEQKTAVEEKNDEVEQARRALEEKATQLATSSRYKSEFLANMSHELRTPLNSLLILAKMLSDNKEGNLSTRDVEYARTILGSGTELLTLINEVLDLSKVEAGKIEIYRGEVPLAGVCEDLEGSFRPIAAQKGLDLEIVLEPNAPFAIVSDHQRLQQILRNLLGNAFKFTESGGVVVRVGVAPKIAAYDTPALSAASPVIAFSVKDSGIGIPPDKQQLIFEAFQQADGTTSRKYGGTGLGLSISRELAKLLGGEIHVESLPGEGSTFTLYLPPIAPNATSPSAPPPAEPLANVADASGSVESSRRPGPRTPEPLDGAFATVVSFLDRKIRNLLVVENDEAQRAAIVELLAGDEGTVCAVGDVADAKRLLAERRSDCLVLDLGLPDRSGYDLVDGLKSDPGLLELPVAVYARHELAQRDEARLKRHPKTILLYGSCPPERLLEETALFIHRIESNLAPGKQRVSKEVHRTDLVLRGKKVLVVDDDVRNIFALTALLEANGMSVSFAENGKDAIEVLERTPSVRLVLMDVMMPGMDGYETTRAIRDDPSYASLPIIALTAKAMKGDREKCIGAGASDYIAKPVDPDQLLSLMRVWLYSE
jgi:signal transduction histidine kinase/DNA-binding response OmpR family regulator/HAMP domain-containing protein